ncbi:MAG: hypothetical protein ACKVQS_08370 [Fimbriimonadaceae bacterium]
MISALVMLTAGIGQSGEVIKAEDFSFQSKPGYAVQVKNKSVFLTQSSGKNTIRTTIESWGKNANGKEFLGKQWDRFVRGWTVTNLTPDVEVKIGESTIWHRTASLSLNSQTEYSGGLVLSTPENTYWANFTSTSLELQTKALTDTLDMLRTVKGQSGSAPGSFPGTTTTTASSNPTTQANSSNPNSAAGTGTTSNPAIPSQTNTTNPSQSNPSTDKYIQLDDQEQARHLRLAQIAEQLYPDQPDLTKAAIDITPQESERLIREAAELCGFTLRDSTGAIVKAPAPEQSIGLTLEISDIPTYAVLHSQAATVGFVDWSKGLDYSWRNFAPKFSSLTYTTEFFTSGRRHPKAGMRALRQFIYQLSVNNGCGSLEGASQDAKLDSIQLLFLTRLVTETVLTPARSELAKRKPFATADLFASVNPLAPLQSAMFPNGWTEDAGNYAMGQWMNQIRDMIIESLAPEKAGTITENIGKVGDAMGAVGSIVKFISTYAYLKGELTILPPGNPMERLLDGSGGQERTLKARFYIDGSEIQNFFKDNRLILNTLTGGTLDFDSPKSQPLTGIHKWEIQQPRDNTDNQIVFVKQGTGDISKLRTDSDGVTKLTLVGAKRRKALDKKLVIPYMRNLQVEAWPQVKETEMGQDMVDAFTTAAGIRGLTPSTVAAGGGKANALISVMNAVFETLYRMNWKGGRYNTLKIKDYIEANAVGELRAQFDYETGRQASDLQTSRSGNGQLESNGLLMQLIDSRETGGYPPGFDAEMMKSLPADIRQKAEEEIAKWRKEQAKNKDGDLIAIYSGGGTIDVSIEHKNDTNGSTGDCDPASVNNYSINQSRKLKVLKDLGENSQQFIYQIFINTKTNEAKVSFEFMGEATQITQETGRRGTLVPSKSTVPIQFLSDIEVEGGHSPILCSLSTKKTDYGTTIFEGTSYRNLLFNREKIGKIGLVWKLEVKDPPKKPPVTKLP